MEAYQEILDTLIMELRRGTIVLGVLSQLGTPTYGYSLVQDLQEKGLPVEAGTLYPLLRRLEKQGLLQSEWELANSKPRKYYMISGTGRQVFDALCGEWKNLTELMDKLMEGGQ